jgi:hypothetical protein
MLLTPLVGYALLVATDLPTYGPHDYYYDRFYAQLQVSLFVVLSLAAHAVLRRSRRALIFVAIISITGGIWAQTPLYGLGNRYSPDARAERLAGCTVFGVAEGDRSARLATAIMQLQRIRDDECRTNAIGGLGYSMTVEFFEGASRLDQLESGLLTIVDPNLRWAACRGVYAAIRETASRRAIAERAGKAMRPYCAQASIEAAKRRENTAQDSVE